MTLPQAVVFDLGKVLVDFDYMRAARAIAAQGTASPDAVSQVINMTPLLFRFERGEMTKEEFYKEVTAATGFKGSLEEFAPIFGDIFWPMPPMIELQAALKKSGVPTYIFSNTNELAITHIQQKFPFFNEFDGYIYSFEHGAMKPTAKLYEVVERVTKQRGEQILYIDDRAENIAAGGARGWRVILQETPEKTLAEIRRVGFSV